MNKEEQQLEALRDIRKMMKDSSKFLSLSGMAGVFAGIYALGGALAGKMVLGRNYRDLSYDPGIFDALTVKLVLICLAVLGLSIVTAYYLSAAKARKRGQNLFDHTSRKVFWSMAIPLMTGGLFCFAMLFHGMILMVSPAMLLFYGLALLNSSKYTMSEIRFLSYSEIALGVLAAFLPGHGLMFWALGFGVLHIVYGTIMWAKYDRRSSSHDV
jgi:hypothetical protein